jgi:hypothetical protein
MFFLDKVASHDEMYELSILQALLMAHNLVTPGKNERGLWMLACGLSKGMSWPVHERVQSRTYSSEMRLIFQTLLFGYQVLESRFSKWVDRVSETKDYFSSQQKLASKWDAAFKGKERNIKVKQRLVQEPEERHPTWTKVTNTIPWPIMEGLIGGLPPKLVLGFQGFVSFGNIPLGLLWPSVLVCGII